VEGTVVFDSAISLLQGLFPPNLNNKIVLANETTVVAPLGGYQYVPGKLGMLLYLKLYTSLFVHVQLKLWNLATIALWKAGPTAQ
jgi:hypothetical protein